MTVWHEGLPVTNRFIVLPPLGRKQASVAAKERLLAFLRQRFPEKQFELGHLPIDDEFTVFPICGTVGDDGDRAHMLAPPPAEVMEDIEEVLRWFDPERTGLS
jgi:hypothetical protein